MEEKVEEAGEVGKFAVEGEDGKGEEALDGCDGAGETACELVEVVEEVFRGVRGQDVCGVVPTTGEQTTPWYLGLS